MAEGRAVAAEGRAVIASNNAEGSANRAASIASLTAVTRDLTNHRMALGGILTKHVLVDETYHLASLADDNKVYKNNVLATTLQAETVQDLVLEHGDVLESKFPIAAVNAEGEAMASVAHAGTEFIAVAIRGITLTVTIKALTDCKVYFYEQFMGPPETGQSDVDGTATSEMDFTANQISDHEIVRSQSSGYVILRIKATGNILCRTSIIADSNNRMIDQELLLPVRERCVLPKMNPALLFAYKAGTPVQTYGGATGYADRGFNSLAVGDGVGTNFNVSLPIEALGDTYLIPHDVVDYYIVFIEANTVVTVSNSTGVLETHVGGASVSFEAPETVSFGPQSGEHPSNPDFHSHYTLGACMVYFKQAVFLKDEQATRCERVFCDRLEAQVCRFFGSGGCHCFFYIGRYGHHGS